MPWRGCSPRINLKSLPPPVVLAFLDSRILTQGQRGTIGEWDLYACVAVYMAKKEMILEDAWHL